MVDAELNHPVCLPMPAEVPLARLLTRAGEGAVSVAPHFGHGAGLGLGIHAEACK